MKKLICQILILVVLGLVSCNPPGNKNKQITNTDSIQERVVNNNKDNIDNIVKEEIKIEINNDYVILHKNVIGQCENIYIYYKSPQKDKLILEKISEKLQSELSTKSKCNLHIFDSDKLGDLIHKYPLSDSEYLKVADHFIFMYDFDKYGWYYPFQDIKYKELGGKNWKKEPIK